MWKNNEGKDQQRFLLGPVRIKVDWWNNTTLITGDQNWAVHGTQVSLTAIRSPVLFASAEGTDREETVAIGHLPVVGQLTLAGQTKGIDCAKACDSSPPSPLCSLNSLPEKERAEIDQLFATVTKLSGKVLGSADLLKMFGLSVDPCKRADTTFANGRIANSGQSECFLSTKVDDIGVALRIPKTLEGQLLSLTDKEVRIAFQNEASSPELKIDDVDLNDDFGGIVTMVSVVPSRALLQVRDSCMAFKVGN
jgi:hypothetical protein